MSILRKMNDYKNQYFDKIGYKDSCIENLLYKMKKDKRAGKWKKERKKCGGWDERSSWNLNTFMVEQIYTWLKIYMDHADGFVNLSFYKFDIDGKQLTQRECILQAISDIEFWLFNDDPNITNIEKRIEINTQAQTKIEEAFKIISLVLPALWW